MVTAQIILQGASDSYDRKYTYAVSSELLSSARPGCRVTVPFSNGNIKKQGLILSLGEAEENEKLKFICDVIDKEPILSDEMLKMCEWMKENVFCTYFDAVSAMIPVGLTYSFSDYYTLNEEFSSVLLNEDEKRLFDFISEQKEADIKKIKKYFGDCECLLSNLTEKEAVFKNREPVRKMGDPLRKYLRIKADFDFGAKLTVRQEEIVDILKNLNEVSLKEIKYFTGVSDSVIKTLEKKEIIEVFEKEESDFKPSSNPKPIRTEIDLTEEQNTAYLGLEALMNDGKPHTSLLYGVTGSGKTSVFLKLADNAVDQNKSVIIMVPEIALTPQIINIFCSRYGNKVAVFHSAMSVGKRLEEYKRVKRGEALICVGTRSAVFAPAQNLGLIIIDEEQEHTYKSEKSPKFHAREIAKFRAEYNNILLCLASATPSMESYSKALHGKYDLFKLKTRYGGVKLPDVEVVDMKKEIVSGNSSAISTALAEEIYKELDKSKQVILLLNRRGHNTYISCASCGWVASCPNCSISLTYHSANHRLMCHYCGYSEKAPSKCPECGAEHIRFLGIGTQKIEEELKLLFKDAKILRLDADSTSSRDSYTKYLKDFSDHKYDIMIGTQMVAKGLDFPDVSLVGVIGADSAQYSDDYRGFERTFSLLTQVIGRAGRSGKRGKAIIQTVDPQSQVISLAKSQDFESFYNSEIMTRKLMIYPPYCTICQISAVSQDAALAQDFIGKIFENIKKLTDKEKGKYSDIKLIILGPSRAAVFKVNNKFRYRMIIKCKNSKRMRECLREAVNIKTTRDIYVSVDIDPETIL